MVKKIDLEKTFEIKCRGLDRFGKPSLSLNEEVDAIVMVNELGETNVLCPHYSRDSFKCKLSDSRGFLRRDCTYDHSPIYQ